MKPLTLLCLLALTGCATAPAPRPVAQASAAHEPELCALSEVPSPVRVETPAGTFLVSPSHAEDFSRLLAGQPTQQHYFAGAD